MSTPDPIGRRALNRATLERQMLIHRAPISAIEALEHLVGVQAQAPDAPYVGLWSRLHDFHVGELGGLISERSAVRCPLMRATVHLVTAKDCAMLRPLVQVVLERGFTGQNFAKQLAGIDMAELIDASSVLLGEAAMTRSELGAALAEKWPRRDRTSLAYAATYLVPVVQVPPRGVWRAGGPAKWASAESWLGLHLNEHSTLEQLVIRYLAAFGPASVRDAQTWSGLTRLQEVADGLGPILRRFSSESGQELLDLRDAPRPDPDVPVPPRFLPEYDNVLLSHSERSRMVTGNRSIPLPPGNGGARGTLLVDGFFQGTWIVTHSDTKARLRIEVFDRLTGSDAQAVTNEGARLLAFVAPQDDPEVLLLGPKSRRAANPKVDQISACHDPATQLRSTGVHCSEQVPQQGGAGGAR